MKLSDMKRNDEAIIKSLPDNIDFARRLSDMGFCYGESVKCITRATFSSPILFAVKGSQVALRQCDAKKIGVIL